MLKDTPTLAIVAVHTAENEPPKVYESASARHRLPRRPSARSAPFRNGEGGASSNNLSKKREIEGQAPDDITKPDNRKPKNELRKERDE